MSCYGELFAFIFVLIVFISFVGSKGRDKSPGYNLSAFYWPQALLSLFKMETFRQRNQNEENPCLESLVFQSEMTARDKEHVRSF
jgi:hypothetical protein